MVALIKALGQLEGPEQYQIVCHPDYPDWLEGQIGYNQEIIVGPSKKTYRFAKGLFGKTWPKFWAIAQRLWLKTSGRIESGKVPPGWTWDSNGFYENLGVSLIHVFHQAFISTRLPMIFNPHDLQHEHFPQFLSPETLARRKYVYYNACHKAVAVVAGSKYTRDDVINRYLINPNKVWTIPLGPATEGFESPDNEFCEEVIKKYGLSHQSFMLYPAVTWEHKNHIRLIKAIIQLRESGFRANLVCTGSTKEPVWSEIQSLISSHHLEDQVSFLGYVPINELRALYHHCQFVIAPSLFEQASGPMFEAWLEDVPIAASNVTSLPDQAGAAALLFDPFSINAIAAAIKKMSSDKSLQDALRSRGRQRLLNFSWDRTSKAYRALYRHVLKQPMTEEDKFLLGWDWLSDPNRISLHDSIC